MSEALVQRGVISTQVLQEFYVNAVRRLGLQAPRAREIVASLGTLCVVAIDVPLVLDAIDAHRLRGISYWDALIVRAAVRARCEVLLSEDLQDGSRHLGIRVENPFREIEEA